MSPSAELAADAFRALLEERTDVTRRLVGELPEQALHDVQGAAARLSSIVNTERTDRALARIHTDREGEG